MKTLKVKMAVVMMLLLGILTAGCSTTSNNKELDNEKLKVTSTIGMIGDVVANIGGQHVESIRLMKPGIDPHLYKASQGDIAKLENADLIFYNGLQLEGKMGEIFKKVEQQKPTIAVTKKLSKELLLQGDVSAGTEFDPHVWFNVQYWISVAEVITEELVKVDPKNAKYYEENAKSYIDQLQVLHEYAKEQIASIPEDSRILVTAHDAFGYFGEAYGMKVVGLQGLSTESEVGSKDVSTLRDFLVKNEIKAVFVESSVPKDTIQAVIEGAKEKGHDVKIGGELFSDAMGEEGSVEGTYIGMFYHNVDTIVSALK